MRPRCRKTNTSVTPSARAAVRAEDARDSARTSVRGARWHLMDVPIGTSGTSRGGMPSNGTCDDHSTPVCVTQTTLVTKRRPSRGLESVARVGESAPGCVLAASKGHDERAHRGHLTSTALAPRTKRRVSIRWTTRRTAPYIRAMQNLLGRRDGFVTLSRDRGVFCGHPSGGDRTPVARASDPAGHLACVEIVCDHIENLKPVGAPLGRQKAAAALHSGGDGARAGSGYARGGASPPARLLVPSPSDHSV